MSLLRNDRPGFSSFLVTFFFSFHKEKKKVTEKFEIKEEIEIKKKFSILILAEEETKT
jgi:hypothetical protein